MTTRRKSITKNVLLQLLAGVALLSVGQGSPNGDGHLQVAGRPLGFPVGSMDGYGFMSFSDFRPVLPFHKEVVDLIAKGDYSAAEKMLDDHLVLARNDLYGYRLAFDIAERQGKLKELAGKWKAFDETVSGYAPTLSQKLSLAYLSEIIRARIRLGTLPKSAEPEAGYDGGIYLQELAGYVPMGRLDAMMLTTVLQRHLDRNVLVTRLGGYLKRDEEFYQLKTYYAYLHQGVYYVEDSSGNKTRKDMDVRDMKRYAEAVIALAPSYAPAYYVAAIASNGDLKKQRFQKCQSLSPKDNIWFLKAQWHLDNIDNSP